MHQLWNNLPSLLIVKDRPSLTQVVDRPLLNHTPLFRRRKFLYRHLFGTSNGGHLLLLPLSKGESNFPAPCCRCPLIPLQKVLLSPYSGLKQYRCWWQLMLAGPWEHLPAALEAFLQPVIEPGVHRGFWTPLQRGLQLAGNLVKTLTILGCFSFNFWRPQYSVSVGRGYP